MKKLILILIKIYQKFFSFDKGYIGAIFGYPKICRYTPTCSEYTYSAIEKYGVILGTLKGSKRIFFCNPFCKGGYDPLK